MAKSRRSRTRRRRNPAGTLLVNPRRGRKSSRRAKHSKRTVSLASLLSRASRSNPRRAKRRTTKRRASRRNPLLTNPRRRRSMKGRSRRRNPLLTNPRRRRGGKRSRARRRNPLLTNPRRRRSSKRRATRRMNPRSYRRRGMSRRRNPLLTNPRHRRGSKRRRNPALGGYVRKARGYGKGIIGKVQGLLRKIPFVGGILSAVVGTAGTALVGALGVLPTDYALPYVKQFIPEWLKPYAYTAVGMTLAGAAKALLPGSFPMKAELTAAIAAGGGAVDIYRWRRGQSMALAGDDYGDDGYYAGDDEMGDVDDDGSPFSATEWAGASLQDADYCAVDMSGEEIGAFEMGRRHFYKRFGPGGGQRQPPPRGGEGGSSPHAGLPGQQWGWLIYWVGFDNAKAIAQQEPSARVEILRKARSLAKLNVQKMLSQGMTDTTMPQAEMAGILVAA